MGSYLIANETEFIETIHEKLFPKPKPPPQHWLLAYINKIYSDATVMFKKQFLIQSDFNDRVLSSISNLIRKENK